MTIIWAGRVVDLLEQIGERRLVPKRQADRQAQMVRAGKAAQRLQGFHNGGHMAVQDLGFSRPAGGREQQQQTAEHAGCP